MYVCNYYNYYYYYYYYYYSSSVFFVCSPVASRFAMFLGRLNRESAMSIDLVWQLSFIGGLVGFGIWLTYLSLKLNHTLGDVLNRGDDIDEIREAVEVVGSILQRLPELVPQFHTNQSPLQPIIEMFMSRMQQNSAETLQTPQALRGSDGRFNGTEGQQEEQHTTQAEI